MTEGLFCCYKYISNIIIYFQTFHKCKCKWINGANAKLLAITKLRESEQLTLASGSPVVLLTFREHSLQDNVRATLKEPNGNLLQWFSKKHKPKHANKFSRNQKKKFPERSGNEEIASWEFFHHSSFIYYLH